jgi:predicted DNA-binding transcriptional regulator YafY
LLHFTDEEAYLLSKAIHKLDTSMPAARKLEQKIVQLFDLDIVTARLIERKDSEIVSGLQKAIFTKKQVVFRYRSGNSLSLTDRLVEPFELYDDFNFIWCFDVEDSENKQFKISRIDEINITGLDWEHANKHKIKPVDVFRCCGELDKHVKLKLSLRAFNLLLEEYPLAERNITKVNDNEYIFEAKLALWEGVMRFIMGLLDQVEILEPEILKEKIKEKLVSARIVQ